MWTMKFYSFDRDIDPMTLVLKLYLDIIEMYVCTENDGPNFSASKVMVWTDTDRQTETRLKLLPTHNWLEIFSYEKPFCVRLS